MKYERRKLGNKKGKRQKEGPTKDLEEAKKEGKIDLKKEYDNEGQKTKTRSK